MNVMKASIGQLKYRHICKLMFSFFFFLLNGTRCNVCFRFIELVAITDAQKVRILR